MRAVKMGLSSVRQRRIRSLYVNQAAYPAYPAIRRLSAYPLVLDAWPLIKRMARRRGTDADHRRDLEAAGMLAVTRAARSFDPSRGVPR
jgi:hypothetical protein